MLPSFEDFKARVDRVLAEIASACAKAGRPAGSVTLLPVTKSLPAAAVGLVARCGLPAVGENRVQEAVEKRGGAEDGAVRWELIGHLQSNKADLAARTFDRIQSVDSVKLLAHLDRAAGELGRSFPVLLQVNAGNDPAKFGAAIEEAPALLEAALRHGHLRVDGLMTIAPLSGDPAIAVRTFANLRALRDRLAERFATPLRELSMGMSGDFAAAIAEGSTLVRIGTALFGARG